MDAIDIKRNCENEKERLLEQYPKEQIEYYIQLVKESEKSTDGKYIISNIVLSEEGSDG